MPSLVMIKLEGKVISKSDNHIKTDELMSFLEDSLSLQENGRRSMDLEQRVVSVSVSAHSWMYF